jgi:hypothetical protein
VDHDVVDGVLVALKVSSTVAANESTASGRQSAYPPRVDINTVAQLRQHLNEVARWRGVAPAQVQADARAEADAAALFQEKRAALDALRQKMELSSAYMLDEHEADKMMQNETHLDREFDRLMKRLESAQRARQGTLPPPIRFEVQ